MDKRDIWVGASVSLVVGITLLTGPPIWWKYVPGHANDASSATANTVSHAGVIGFEGGCAPFIVYAQNRWLPYGAAIRSAPRITSKQLASRDPNQVIPVDGWVHSQVAYTTNKPPWNTDIWFHLADGAGWVSFAGVRSTVTDQDMTLRADGGPPVPLAATCQGAAQ